MNKYYIGFTLLLLAAILSACQNDILLDDVMSSEGKPALVRLTINAVPLSSTSGTSRAIPEEIDVSDVKDVWFIEYDENGMLLGVPKYYTSEDFTDDNKLSMPIILPSDNSIKYTLVAVANTHSEIRDSALGDVLTLQNLKKTCRYITSPSDCYNVGDVLMSSVIELTSETEEISCTLYRNIAKVSFIVKNSANSDVLIESVVLRNVPGVLYIADRLYNDDVLIPSEQTTSFIEFPIEIAEIDENNSQCFEYYMPRNCRGASSSSQESNKNSSAPDFATYFEINAKEKSTNVPLRFRFYPGANMKNDFNILPNHHYTLPITINNPGNASTDNRVERFERIELKEANSYIVNPLKGEYQQVYSIPLTRANLFWSSEDGKIAVNSEGNPENNVIDETTQWVAEVIWQDQNHRIIDFCDKNGDISNENTYTGIGLNYINFKPRKGAEGNVLIGVRKSTEQNDYLWSWHLWITDYNPDQKADFGWQNDVYSYNVDGGEIHRYYKWPDKYKDKYIMDRNFGAFTNEPDDVNTTDRNVRCRGMFWVYGKKDPIPYYTTVLYDINGKQISSNWDNESGNGVIVIKNEAAQYLYQAIKSPCTWYRPKHSNTASEQHWNLTYAAEKWYNPTWHTSESGKSLFDPCPPGWKLIDTSDVWNCFNAYNVNGYMQPNALETYWDDVEKKEWNAASLKFQKDKGFHFYIDDKNEKTAWYPCANTNRGSYSSDNGGSNDGRYLVAEHSKSINTWITTMYFNHYSFSQSSSVYMRFAFPVRCIKE